MGIIIKEGICGWVVVFGIRVFAIFNGVVILVVGFGSGGRESTIS